MSGELAVNEHYLNRVIDVAATAGVEATEDIVTGNGIKLVAKGARIDAHSRERLLEHKLRKPLETSVRVIDGVASRPIDVVARTLLEQHALLAGVCGRPAARIVCAALRELRLTTPMDSLLSVYAAHEPGKLEHAVGISLLGAAAYHDLPAGGPAGVPVLILAGLMHDIGELYIDPAILKAGAALTPEQWRHIGAHPVIGARVLREMHGGGQKVADAVLYHHERLDGFGYPHGLQGSAVPLSGQVLALAEMLMGMLESGHRPAQRASVAVKLIPGEFNRQLQDRVAAAARAAEGGEPAPALDPSAVAARAWSWRMSMQRLVDLAPVLEQRAGTGSVGLKALIGHVIERCRRISQALTSTGLDMPSAAALQASLASLDAAVLGEAAIVLREIEWRLREVERETRMRIERLPEAEAALVRGFIEQGKAVASQAAA